MFDDAVIEWSVKRLPSPFPTFMECVKAVTGFFPYLLVGFILAGVYLYFEQDSLTIAMMMPGIAIGLLLLTYSCFAAIVLLMWVVGYGYTYRLDAKGFSLAFFWGRRGKSAKEISANRSKDMHSGPFSGWAVWEWLREHEYVLYTNDAAGMIELRSKTGKAADGTKIPRIWLFCTDRQQRETVARFIHNHLK